jgi:hypothetical protein
MYRKAEYKVEHGNVKQVFNTRTVEHQNINIEVNPEFSL